MLQSIFDEIDNNQDIQKLGLTALGKDYLVLNWYTIMDRIEELKKEEINLTYVPISFFQATKVEFKQLMQDLINDYHLRVRFYLENHFNLDYETVRHRLHLLPNTHLYKYSKANASKIIDFLVLMNVPKNHIIECIYLILFDYKLVRSAYYNACSQYKESFHENPNFYKHIFDFVVLSRQQLVT